MEFAAAGVAFALCLLFGSGWFSTWLFALGGVLNLPTALGVPAGLPGLRLWPLGEAGWWTVITDTAAAVVFVAVVFGWLSGTRRRRPEAGALRLLAGGWTATIAAGLAAAAVRVVVTSFVSGPGLNVYLGVAGAALGFALLWSLACGWLVGLAAMAAHRFAATVAVVPAGTAGTSEPA